MAGKLKMFETFKRRALLAALLMLLGFSFGMVYVFASGLSSQEYAVVLDERGNTLGFFTFEVIWVGEDPLSISVSERVKLEEQAIDAALRDSRVRELIEGKQYSVVSAYYVGFQAKVVSQMAIT